MVCIYRNKSHRNLIFFYYFYLFFAPFTVFYPSIHPSIHFLLFSRNSVIYQYRTDYYYITTLVEYFSELLLLLLSLPSLSIAYFNYLTTITPYTCCLFIPNLPRPQEEENRQNYPLRYTHTHQVPWRPTNPARTQRVFPQLLPQYHPPPPPRNERN